MERFAKVAPQCVVCSHNYGMKRISPEEPHKLHGGDQIRLGAKDGGALFHVVENLMGRTLTCLQVETGSSAKRGRDTAEDTEPAVKKEKHDGPVRALVETCYIPAQSQCHSLVSTQLKVKHLLLKYSGVANPVSDRDPKGKEIKARTKVGGKTCEVVRG
eukprot:768571-Hanusia_phi.AAC.12